MSIFEDAARAVGRGTDTDTSDDSDGDTPPNRGVSKGGTGTLGGAFTTTMRGQEVNIDGDDLTLARPETKQPDEKTGNWLTATDAYGVPRGVEAAKQRQIVQTAAMQSIVNGIVDQLLGGELVFLDDDTMENLSDAEAEQAGRLKRILRDVLTGPHMGDEDLDDLVTACVEDMLGPGNAYLQLLEPEGGSLPVAALTTLDPLTIRHNFDDHGFPEDPPYWQALGAFSSSSFSAAGVMEPVPLDQEDVAVMRYPKGHRSYRRYPVSASWQIKEWLEILADSVTHHKRYYSDNEVPPGLMQIVGASNSTINDIKNQIEQASGDPRDFPIAGGEAPANWVEMGGTAINLDVIQEQQWFYQLCLGSLGLGKAEVGMIEDVNRANGEIEADRVYKRVAGPFGKQFERAFVHVARQFDAYTDLGEPFKPTLAYTDPRAEAAKQERLKNEYEAGKISLREYRRRSGDEDIAEDPEAFTATVNGETVDYGDHPKWVAQRLLSAAGATDPNEPAPDEEQSTRSTRQESYTDYPEAASENAQMALDAREDTGNPNDCGTDVGWARANQLADREPVSRDTVRRMAAFRRHQDNAEMEDDEGRADCGWMMWHAWGGEEGISWAERKVEEWEDKEDGE